MAARIQPLPDGPPPVCEPGVVYTTRRLSVRDAVLRGGGMALFGPLPTADPWPPVHEAVSLPTGTLWLSLGTVDTPEGTFGLSAAERRLVTVLADGAWHSDGALLAALPPGSSAVRRVHSAVARLRRKGVAVERAYGGGWRLATVGERATSVGLEALLQRDDPVDTATLCRALGCSPGTLRVRIHRLRQGGAPVETTDAGYRWRSDDPLVGDLKDALRRHPLVVLWGPLGVGKTHLARRVHAGLTLDARGMAPARLVRRLAALARQGPASILVDGVGDPEPVRPALDALVASGHRVLVTARRPLHAEGAAHHVAMARWTDAELARIFPDRDVAAWDGLPLGAFPVDTVAAHLDAGSWDPADQDAAALAASRPAGDATPWPPGVQARLQRLGCLSDSGRLLAPVRRALRATWSDAQWNALADRVVTLHAQRLSRQSVPVPPEAQASDAIEVLEALTARGLPTHALALVLFTTEHLRCAATLHRALEHCTDADHRASLLYSLWLLEPDGDDRDQLLERAIDESLPAMANGFRTELAYAVWFRDRPAALAHFEAVGRWLDAQPPDAHPWLRTNWVASRVLRDPMALEPATLIAHVAHVEALCLASPVPKAKFMIGVACHALGVASLARDQLHTTIAALERAVQVFGADAARRGAVDLLMAYVRAESFDRARALWPLVRDADMNPRWDAHRRTVRGLWLLAEGKVDEARQAAAPLPVDRHGAVLVAVLSVLDGEAVAPSVDRLDALEALAEVVRGGPPARLLAVPPGRILSGPLLHSIATRCVPPG